MSSENYQMFSTTTTVRVNNQHGTTRTILPSSFSSSSSSLMHEDAHSKSISAFQRSLDKVAKFNSTLSKSGSNANAPSSVKVDAITASCLITLCKVLDNILLERQYNPKTRSIKLGNKLFRDRVGKVPGGVEFLLGCNFQYERIASKTPLKKDANGTIPANAIKLLQGNESRELLVASRRYLQDYCENILDMKVGKHRNEIPAYIIQDEISVEMLKAIEMNIASVMKRNGKDICNDGDGDGDETMQIENMETISRQRSEDYDLSSTSSVMTPMSHPLDMSESAPPSPFTVGNSQDDASFVSTSSRRKQSKDGEEKKLDSPFIGENEEANEAQNLEFMIENKTPVKSEPDLQIPSDISPVVMAKESPLESNFTLTTAKMSNDGNDSPCGVEDRDSRNKASKDSSFRLSQSLEDRLELLNVQRQGSGLDLSEDLDGDDASLGFSKESECTKELTDKELENLEHITKSDTDGDSEDARVQLIVTGNSMLPPSKSGSLFHKLNKLRCKKGKDLDQKIACDQKSVGAISASSQIRIKNTDGLSVNSGMLRRRRNSSVIHKKDRNDIKTLGIQINHDVYGVDVGLKLFFAIFVLTYNFADDMFNEDHLLQPDVSAVSAIGPSVPVEIVYKLWTALLRSERSFNKMDGREIMGTFVEITKSQAMETQVTAFSSLGKEDAGMCQLIVRLLRESGAIDVSEIALVMHQSSVGGRNANSRIGISISREESRQYGLDLASKSLNIKYEYELNDSGASAVQKLRARCHHILASSLLENIDLESKDDIFVDKNVDFDLLSTWYIIRWLPHHMLSADMTEKAIRLLLDKRYMQVRLESNGLHCGTLQYLNECEIIRSVAIENDTSTSSVVSDDGYGIRVVKAVLEGVHSYLDETRKQYSHATILRSKNKSFCDLASALHCLAVAIGDLNGMRRVEVDILNESLRFHIAGDADKSAIADTQLQLASCYHAVGDPTKAITSYGEALQLNMDIYGDEYHGLSKILYHMGVLYCDQDQYGSALECFQKALVVSHCQPKESRIDENIAKIYCWIGNVHRNSGNSFVALQYFEKARDALEQAAGRNDLEMAEILQNIGVIYDDLGDDEKSLKAFSECLQIRRRLLSPEFHKDICETIGCMANVYKKSNVEKALRLFRIILNERAKVSTDEGDGELLQCYEDMLDVAKMKLLSEGTDELHAEIATLYFRKGSLLESLGRYTYAIDCYLRSLKIRKIKKHYKEIGNLLNSLGIAHAKRRSYKKAMKCFTDSLKVRKTVLGPHHEECGETLHNMGNCAAKQFDFDKAAECYEKSLIIKRLAYGNKSLSTAKTLHNIGVVNEDLGLLDDSLNYYKDALAVRTILLGKRHIDIAFSLHSIGTIYQKTGQHEKALECLEASLRLKKKHYVGEHLSVAETMNVLASSYVSLGKTDDAISTFEETLIIFEKKYGAHATTASVLDSLGSVSLSKGSFDKAHRYLERALALKRIVYGDDDVEVSNTLFYVGKVQSRNGDMDDALDTFKEVLRIRKRIYGDDSTEVAAIINDVGVIQLRRGQNDVAENCFLEAQRIWGLQEGHNKEYLGETLVNLGEIHHVNKRYDEAIISFGEALSLFEAVHDKSSLSIAVVLHKLGRSQKEQGNYDDSLTSFERALSARIDKLGDSHILVAEVMKDIGDVCQILGDLLKAREYLGEALKTMINYSPNGLTTADTFYSMGKVMMKMKYKDEAFEAYSNALRIKRKRLEEDDLDVAYILSEIGLIHEERKQWQSSLDMYGQSLKIRESILGDHELVGDSYFSIGTVQQTVRKCKPALASYGSALVMYQKVLGDDDITCAKAMNNIGILYEGIEQFDEALKYHKESLRIRRMHLGVDHIKIANSLDNIAGIYQKQNESDQALQSLKESLKIRSRFGNDNLDVATTLFGMGIIYCDKGDTSKALECYEAALEIRKRRGKEFEVAQTLHNIGSLFALRQDYRRALKQWQNALQIYRRKLDDDHHMVACTLGNIKMAENMIQEERSQKM